MARRAGSMGTRSASARLLLAISLVIPIAVVIAAGESPPGPVARAEPSVDALVPLVPQRLLETRKVEGATTADGKFEGAGGSQPARSSSSRSPNAVVCRAMPSLHS